MNIKKLIHNYFITFDVYKNKYLKVICGYLNYSEADYGYSWKKCQRWTCR